MEWVKAVFFLPGKDVDRSMRRVCVADNGKLTRTCLFCNHVSTHSKKNVRESQASYSLTHSVWLLESLRMTEAG